MIRVSVVVPTYRRPEMLRRCLRSLIRQRFDPAAFEIIVADNGGDPATERLVRRLARVKRPALRYVNAAAKRGPAAARNAGWRAASGEIIAFTDDDCQPEPDWLGAGVEAMRPEVNAAHGRIVMPLPPNPTDYELNASLLQQAGFVTANCFCRRTALERIDGFDERFTKAWREDSDLYFRLLQLPGAVAGAPKAVVVHPVRPAAWGVSLKQMRNVFFDALLYKKHPVLFQQTIRRSPPWLYYAIVASLIASLTGLAAGIPAVALSSGAAWAVMTGGFFLKRTRSTSRRLAHVAEMVVTSALIPALAVYWRLRGALHFRVRFL